ncbi:MAG: hypothetical protein K0R17_3250 [Rariglobus sp.]|nr:hypothetical protein [Rariglobus sp.]
MNRPLAIFLALLACAAPSAAQTTAPKVIPSAPIKNFRLPTFDKEGKRATFMRAGEALFITPTQIEVKDMHFTLFTKDGTGAFDTVLLAPSATFLTDQRIVSGKDSVRLIRINLEVTGEQWSYNHLEKRVLIGNNARVTFQDELKDIIK